MIIEAVATTIRQEDVAKWLEIYDTKLKNLEPERGGTESTSETFETLRRSTQVVINALNDFEEFSNEYSEFVERLIREETNFASDETTPERLRERFQSSFNNYWAPLGQVAMQRLVPFYQEYLDKATDKANDYLQQFNLNDGVLVYFKKVNSIRHYPYSDVAFIGIPYLQSILGNTDMMAIPHELGHYLYWNFLEDDPPLDGQELDDNGAGAKLTRVRSKHEDIKQKLTASGHKDAVENGDAIERALLQWTEEIFCDVVGTFLEGDQFVRSTQTFLQAAAGNKHDLTYIDGPHPPLCLRPIIREIAHQMFTHGVNTEIDWDDFIIDWDVFFDDAFKIANPLVLDLAVIDPSVETMGKSELFKSLAHEDNGEVGLPHFDILARDFVPGLTLLIREVANSVLTIVNRPIAYKNTEVVQPSNFVMMMQTAEQEAAKQNRRLYDILFIPRSIEGGLHHSHVTYSLTVGRHIGTLHDFGAHSH